jgi:hypothetical protein
VMAHLVRDHVRLREFARRAETVGQFLKESQIQIKPPVNTSARRPRDGAKSEDGGRAQRPDYTIRYERRQYIHARSLVRDIVSYSSK